LTRDEFIEYSLALWTFAPEMKMKGYGHPAMFPEEMPKRLIKMLSYKGDVVLDPFAGISTTLKVAKDLGRRYIGFEIDEKYYQASKERLL
jgi:DNA modification methylase